VKFRGLTDCERELLDWFPEKIAHLYSYVTSDAARVHGSRARFGFGRTGRKGLCTEKHTDGFRPMKTEPFSGCVLFIATHPALRCAVQ
jgi:hypothetical protein